MPMHDFRTKPDTQWTFYVVDNLATMSNLYRYDTVEEAIQKYQSLPGNLRSAIGSSIHTAPGGNIMNRHEIDHIHRNDGKSVLVRDMDRMPTPLWRESQEIADAVKLMRQQLGVEYEKSGLFGSMYGSVAIPVADDAPMLHSQKKLSPKIDDRPLSGINEVFVSGQGWVDILQFLDDLNNRPFTPGVGYPVPFVDTLNIRYVDDRGHFGQVDVSPAEFMRLQEQYIKDRERKPSLDAKIANADAKVSKQNGTGQGRQAPEHEHEEERK